MDFAEQFNSHPVGWSGANGLKFIRACGEEVVADMDIQPQHLQPYGLVHGGVLAALVEEVASVGATLHSMPSGQLAVGLDNHTTFLKAVRMGKLRATARPVARGRRTHVWHVQITDHEGTKVACGSVRLMCLDRGSALAGTQLEMDSTIKP